MTVKFARRKLYNLVVLILILKKEAKIELKWEELDALPFILEKTSPRHTSCLSLNIGLPLKNENQQTYFSFCNNASKSFYNLFPPQHNQTLYLKSTNTQVLSTKELHSF